MDIKQNHARSLVDLEKPQQNAEVLRWLKERKKALLEGNVDWIEREERLQGRGGGGFIALRNQREDSIVGLEVSHVNAQNNSARIGGKELLGI